MATTKLNGRAGLNKRVLAGRWHGDLVPARKVQILVQLSADGHWKTSKALTLIIKHGRPK